MFSDHAITLAGRSITITTHDTFMAGVLVAIGLLFLLALYFNRKRIVVLQQSDAAEELNYELARIAGALERIASGPADRAISAAMQPTKPSPQRESGGIPYSMFGR